MGNLCSWKMGKSTSNRQRGFKLVSNLQVSPFIHINNVVVTGGTCDLCAFLVGHM